MKIGDHELGTSLNLNLVPSNGMNLSYILYHTKRETWSYFGERTIYEQVESYPSLTLNHYMPINPFIHV